MKAKLLKVFTVCLITLTILSPEIAVFGIVWQQHLHLEKTNLIVSDLSVSEKLYKPLNKSLNASQQDILFEKSFLNHESNNSVLFIVNKYQIIVALELLLICIPVGIGLSVLAYEKYLIYRAEVYRQQVEILERIWLHK